MSAGEGDVGGRRAASRADVGRRVAFPALLLALALFCVEGLQLLSSVVRNDLTSPPLVEVPAIDLGSSPPPDRTEAVPGAEVEAPAAATAGAELAAPPTQIVEGVAVVERAKPSSPGDPAASFADPTSDPSDLTPVDAVLPTAVLPTAVTALPVDPGADLGAASVDAEDRPARRKAPPGGPPAGRPVGPDCDDVPGRRAACDRRLPIG